ncbi:MAG: SsrA-binding protein SmpB [Nitrospinae bacterium]|nr:SsrA-binding protein SmpB [Nitrospinota bacterium]
MGKGKGAKGERAGGPPTIHNRKARHDYHILDSMEAGVVLKGNEVKSIRQGKVTLHDAFARVTKGEAWLCGCHINPYQAQNTFTTYDPMRDRKLLLHKRQIAQLAAATQEKGMTLLPLKLYFKKGQVKIELGVGKGKKQYDKREDLKRRDAEREMDRAMKR